MTTVIREQQFRKNFALVAIKLVHTGIWAFFAACILALPIVALVHRFNWAFILTVFIVCECTVLAVNKGRCPLTLMAAHYTNEREDNFDIYLPKWLARHNKLIFGVLFVVNECVVLWCWRVLS